MSVYRAVHQHAVIYSEWSPLLLLSEYVHPHLSVGFVLDVDLSLVDLVLHKKIFHPDVICPFAA